MLTAREGRHSQGRSRRERRLHYLSFYLEPGMEQVREQVPAGFVKVEYIKDVAVAAGADVRVVSTAVAKPGKRLLRGKVSRVSDNETHIYLPTVRLPKLTTPYLWLQVLWYLIVHVRSRDALLVYHSLSYIWPIKIARRLKRFHFVLEFNDLYHAITTPTRRNSIAREDRFIRSADAYLVMNRIAAGRFTEGKPFVESYGSYRVPEREVNRREDGRIHVVYGGIVESGRRAAELAVRAAEFLDPQYDVHILGFGTENELASLTELIASVNAKRDREVVRFYGTLRGKDYTDFLHRCHIGLSTHAYTRARQESADYTFPSKIPAYMAHDLRVVSPAIRCVVDSPFEEFISFYHQHTPEAIAHAIAACLKQEGRSPEDLIGRLDLQFKSALLKVLFP